MNDDAWYTSFAPATRKQGLQNAPSKRRETVNEGIRADIPPVENLLQSVEEEEKANGPPAATVARRAKSYSDFYDVVRAHIKKENRLEREKQRKLYKQKQIKTSLEFASWYQTVQNDLVDASCSDYQSYHDQLHLAEQHLDSLLTSAHSALHLLSTLSTNFKAVEAQTTAFQAQCENLLNDQKKTLSLADGIAENLQYYTYLEPMTRRLNAPGAGRLVGGAEFTSILSNLDACLEYMQSHPSHRESAAYRAKYRLLLTRSLTLIRNHFASAIKDVLADVQKRIAERQMNDTTQSALLYAKFRVPAPELRAIGGEIQRRAVLPAGAEPSAEAEYQGLVNELYGVYSAARSRLIRPIIGKKMEELSASPTASKDLVSFAQSGMAFLRGMCADEFELWSEYFAPAESEDALYEFLEELVEPFYDYMRPRTIHEPLIQKLCELCGMMQTRYMENESDDDEDGDLGNAEGQSSGRGKLDFEHLVTPALEDAQSRLAFLTLTTLRNDIENFKPKPEDLNYPAKTSQAQNGNTKAKGPVLSGRKNSNANGTLAKVLAEDDPDSVYAATLQDTYPTLRKAVWLLSRIYRLVHSSIFDDLAHQIVHQTTASLIYASTLIAKQASPTDAHLFLIKHLLLLKQQIVAFDIEFVSPDVQFDFSAVTNTFWELRSRGGLFNPLNLVRLVGGSLVPKVVTNMLDAKAELDGRLRTVINEFVDSFASRMAKSLQAPKKGVPLTLGEAHKSASETRKTVEKDVPFLRKKLSEYIEDPRTRETLVAAVMDKVVERYEDWYEEGNLGRGTAGGRKGKGREDEIWSPGAFGEWAQGVFDVGRLGFLEHEDEGMSRRASEAGSV